MATFDAHANLAITSVTVPPSPAISGTALTVTTGTAALFPAVPFNCTIYPSTANPTQSNAEIVRVTNITGDVLTITRAQEGTTAKAILAGYKIANTATAKVFTDIETAVNAVTAGVGIVSLSAGTTVATGPQIVFSNSNGVSFGLSGNTLTASAVGGGGGAAISGGANSQSTGTVVFSNSNNITFGLSNNGVMTASVSFAQSTQPVAASASNGSFAFSTLGFSNANGVTFGTSAGSIISASVAAPTPAGSLSAGTTSVALGQVIFSNSNNVSFGLDGSTVTASASSPAETPFGVSAGTQSVSTGTLVFSNSNNVTFGMSGSSRITASVTVASTQGSIILSGGTTSNSGSQFVFSNSNNVSFGLNGSTMTASATVASTQGSVVFGAVGSTNTGSQLILSNSNNVSFGLNGSTFTASVTVASTQGSLAFGAVGSTNTGSQVIFSNSNNVTFGLNASTFTASVTVASTQGSFRLSAGTTNNLVSNFSFSDGSNVSFGLNGSTITASVASSLTNIRVSGGTTSNLMSAISFEDGGGVSFGLNGSVLTASAPGAAASPVNISAGTTSNNLASVVFSNSNRMSFGLSGSTITMSGVEELKSFYTPPWGMSGMASNSSLAQNSLYFQPFDLPFDLYASRINFYLSVSGALSAGNSTGTCYVAAGFGLYTRDVTGAASTRIGLVTSYSMSVIQQSMSSNTVYAATHYIGLSNASSHSTSQVAISSSNASTYQVSRVNGMKVVAFPMFSSIMTAGRYWLGFSVSTITGNAMTNGVSVAITSVPAQQAIGIWGGNSLTATNSPVCPRQMGWGRYSASSNAWPASIAISTGVIQNFVTATLVHFDLVGASTATNFVQ